MERFTSQKGSRGLQASSGVSRKISLFHKNLKNLTGGRLEKIKVNLSQFSFR